MLQTYEQHSRAKLTATIVAVLVVAGIVMLTDHIKAASGKPISVLTQSTASTSPSASSSSSTPAGAASPSATSGSSSSGSVASANSSGFTNGTYTTSSGYFVPSGNESIAVNLTLQNGVITNASIQNSENDPTSAVFQQDFASSYKSVVVGRKISSLHLSVVAGASDTTQAFNNALSQIASKAQA